MSLGCGIGLASAVADHRLAQRLDANGVVVTAEAVRVFTGCGGRGCDDDKVEVRLPGRSAPSVLRDIKDPGGPANEWATPATGSRYAPPLDVAMDPTDPHDAMAVRDLEEELQGSTLQLLIVITALVWGVTLAACAVAAWAAAQERRLAQLRAARRRGR